MSNTIAKELAIQLVSETERVTAIKSKAGVITFMSYLSCMSTLFKAFDLALREIASTEASELMEAGLMNKDGTPTKKANLTEDEMATFLNSKDYKKP